MSQESEHAKFIKEHEEILNIQRETGMNFHEARIEWRKRQLSDRAYMAAEGVHPIKTGFAEIKPQVPDFKEGQ